MATPQQIRDAIDTRLAALWPVLVSRQATYLAARGRYYQGRRTHAADPADGASAAADRLADRPTDQADDWAAFGVANWTEAFALELHVYDGPAGRGWVAVATVSIAGRQFRRAKGVGPEGRDSGWQQVDVRN